MPIRQTHFVFALYFFLSCLSVFDMKIHSFEMLHWYLYDAKFGNHSKSQCLPEFVFVFSVSIVGSTVKNQSEKDWTASVQVENESSAFVCVFVSLVLLFRRSRVLFTRVSVRFSFGGKLKTRHARDSNKLHWLKKRSRWSMRARASVTLSTITDRSTIFPMSHSIRSKPMACSFGRFFIGSNCRSHIRYRFNGICIACAFTIVRIFSLSFTSLEHNCRSVRVANCKIRQHNFYIRRCIAMQAKRSKRVHVRECMQQQRNPKHHWHSIHSFRLNTSHEWHSLFASSPLHFVIWHVDVGWLCSISWQRFRFSLRSRFYFFERVRVALGLYATRCDFIWMANETICKWLHNTQHAHVLKVINWWRETVI